jgi:hypothetical protein
LKFCGQIGHGDSEERIRAGKEFGLRLRKRQS